MFVDFCPAMRSIFNPYTREEAWVAWEHSIFTSHVLDDRERVRWEWGECCWTARILAEGEETRYSLQRRLNEY